MKKLEHEILEIKAQLAEMSSKVTQMLEKSMQSLVESDTPLAENVIKMDDEVDAIDSLIDEKCLTILALYEPKAIDLRYITTVLRIIVDLERIGDHCVDIAKEVRNINQYPPIKPYIDLPRMAKITMEMIQASLSAFFNRDVTLALTTIKQDDIIDNLHKQILRELLTYIAEDIRKTSVAISLMFIVRSIERIADHSTNICEMVYFMNTGKNIKHKNINEIMENYEQ
ncbi:phosphate signaling complex protein PhoU [Deferribacterales bacterium Es71-Z0220]|jgi:phosphate transport system protein|uniref:phosphate signaling complex protein PhoU n=1 Tax=Deferrivibrio essentukiensis TaxID=2880922 RepID=UPI001F620895|nr:phosphate signaling complex protein PhoU [Deferrivibrio essentukiensis]MBZ4672081.1 phosphate uptake regulator, PhoU [Deferribacteraceae bacterium]MCB4204386.1 phosphate signaling complex protein PhoU [Deferrivibrio essentukiensis]